MSEWPLIGRALELRRIDSLLGARTKSVVLAGPAGVGKSRMGDECLRLAANHGFATIRVACTKSAAAVPFGPFASLLPDLSTGADRGDVLRQIASAIVARRGNRGVAVLIDDAHLLDEPSSVLTHQLAADDQAFVVATLRSAEAAPDAVVALWKDGMAERLELSPLSLEEVDELVAAVLGEPADGATVRVLWERTQGNVLFLKELIVAAQENGALINDSGIWRLRGRPFASARLVELVDARLGGLDAEDRHALAILAVGEPLALDFYASLAGEERLASLEDRGLIHVERDGRRLRVRLEHPLYGDILRVRLSPRRERAVCRELAEHLERTGGRRRDDVLRLSAWRLEGGGAMRPDLMVAAAHQARARWDLPLAERLAGAALDAGAGFDAALLLGQLYWLQGRADEAEQQLGGLVSMASTDGDRAALAASRMDCLLMGLSRLDDAVRVGEEGERTIGDLRCRDKIAAQRARLLYLSGRLPPAVEVLEPIVARSEGPTLVDACITAASALGLSGRARAALDAAERGLAAHLDLQDGLPTLGPHIHVVTRCLVLTHSGQLREAEQLARAQYDQVTAEKDVEAQAFICAFLARTLLVQGRVVSAERWARESASLFRERGAPFFLRNALMPLALSLALLGHVDEGRAAVAELYALGPESYLFGPEIPHAAAWLEVAGGDLGAARRLLERSVDLARASGERVLEVAALHDIARLGGAGHVAPLLHDLAAVVEGPLAATRAAHAAVLVERDPAGLASVSRAFESMGANLLAAEAAADAAAHYRRAGDPRPSVALERRMEVLVKRCEGVRTPALAIGGQVRATLTARELEIARLAAHGHSNRAIAERLHLSLHTVENKLHVSYEKLGIGGRAELTEALRQD